MNAALTTAASALASQIAALPSRSVFDCQEQDLVVADACQGNGDAWQILTRAIEDIRATVEMDWEHEAERAA